MVFGDPGLVLALLKRVADRLEIGALALHLVPLRVEVLGVALAVAAARRQLGRVIALAPAVVADLLLVAERLLAPEVLPADRLEVVADRRARALVGEAHVHVVVHLARSRRGLVAPAGVVRALVLEDAHDVGPVPLVGHVLVPQRQEEALGLEDGDRARAFVALVGHGGSGGHVGVGGVGDHLGHLLARGVVVGQVDGGGVLAHRRCFIIMKISPKISL
nr:hypothetical protein [Cressdnaviricota sp.]UOF82580.1 hypothetical protein [Cressdnaviricota sp.]